MSGGWHIAITEDPEKPGLFNVETIPSDEFDDCKNADAKKAQVRNYLCLDERVVIACVEIPSNTAALRILAELLTMDSDDTVARLIKKLLAAAYQHGRGPKELSFIPWPDNFTEDAMAAKLCELAGRRCERYCSSRVVKNGESVAMYADPGEESSVVCLRYTSQL